MSKLPMNLPNRITIGRILLIPVYLLLMAAGGDARNEWAALVFAIAAASDFADGRIARKRGLVTDFGKFMDPIADKLLVLLPLMWLVPARGGPPEVWMVMIMVAREIIVSGFRLVAAGRGVVIGADRSGKVKTAVQMLTVLCLTLDFAVGWPCLYAAAALSAYSGAELIFKNRRVLLEAGE